MIQAAFVHIPKTGGTSIKSMFKGLLFNMQHGPLSGYADAFAAKHGDGWDNLYKFTIVRNPWARYVAFYLHHRNAWLRRGVMDDEYDFTSFIEKIVPASVIRNQNPQQMIGDGRLNHTIQLEYFEYGVKEISQDIGVPIPKIEHLNVTNLSGVADYRPFYNEATRDHVATFGAWEIERFGYTFGDCVGVA